MADRFRSVTAETGREFDQLATYLTAPRDSPSPGGGFDSQPDALVNYFSQPKPSVTPLGRVLAICQRSPNDDTGACTQPNSTRRQAVSRSADAQNCWLSSEPPPPRSRRHRHPTTTGSRHRHREGARGWVTVKGCRGVAVPPAGLRFRVPRTSSSMRRPSARVPRAGP